MSFEDKHPIATEHAANAAEQIAAGLEAVENDTAKAAVIDKVNQELRSAGIADVELVPTDDDEVGQRVGVRSGLTRNAILQQIADRRPVRRRAIRHL